jgi:hypothetical protein
MPISIVLAPLTILFSAFRKKDCMPPAGALDDSMLFASKKEKYATRYALLGREVLYKYPLGAFVFVLVK